MRADFRNDITTDEYLEAARHGYARLSRRLPLRHLQQLGVFLASMLAGVALMHVSWAGDIPAWVRAALVSAGIAGAILAYGATRIGQRRLVERGYVNRSGSFTLAEEGLVFDGEGVNSHVRWSALRGIDRTARVLMLYLDDVHFIPISVSAFESTEECEEFLRLVASKAPPAALTSTASPPASAAQPPETRDDRFPVRTRIADALRIAFFRPVAPSHWQASWGEVLAAAIIGVAIPTAFGMISEGSAGHVDPFGLPNVFFPFVVVMVAAVLLAWSTRKREAVSTLALGCLLGWAVIDLVTLSAWTALENLAAVPRHLETAFFYLPLAWWGLAVARFATPLHEFATPRRALTALVAILVLAVPMGAVSPDRSLWVHDWSRDAATRSDRSQWRAVNNEKAFYAQPGVLATELDAVERGRPGVVDVFFIGMAGYGYQDVFMREVDAVSRLMKERFDAKGRTIRLVNNPKTLFDTPIASLTSLKAALKRVAERMDPDEDVLVLFMTSHGSSDHQFSLSLGSMNFEALDPDALRRALDESGIRNRVVIISACYAGGFSQRLADDNTLVIAAAAPDRKSFGCSNEADWTYFGRAYFADALSKTYSFTEAFRQAAPAVEARERAENRDPSAPVMAGGAALATTLARLEQRLASPSAPEPVVPVRSDGKDEVYRRFVDLTFDPRVFETWEKVCRQSMRSESPEVWVERNPATYGGMDKRHALWPQLSAAWDRYANEYCSRANDATRLRASYEQALRSETTPDALAWAMTTLSTADGRRWLDINKRVDMANFVDLSHRNEEIQRAAYARYLAEMDRIGKEFMKGRENRRAER